MQINEKISNETSGAPQITGRKIYQKPRLEMLGDLRAVILAGSSGLGESGRGGSNRGPGFINPLTGQPYP